MVGGFKARWITEYTIHAELKVRSVIGGREWGKGRESREEKKKKERTRQRERKEKKEKSCLPLRRAAGRREQKWAELVS